MDTSGKNLENKEKTFSGKKNFTNEELDKILKFGAEDIFHQNEQISEKDLHEMDIEDILERAEKTNPDELDQRKDFFFN